MKREQIQITAIREISNANGFIYKAPNGNRSFLNKYNWLLTRTGLFTQWFGNWINIEDNKLTEEPSSVVRDENQEPLIVSEISKNGLQGTTLFKNHYSTNNRISDKNYFLNIRNIIELKDCDWYYNFFNQLIVKLYGLTMHDLLNLMNRYDMKDNDIKNNIIWLFDDEMTGYINGEKLAEFLKNKILYQRVLNNPDFEDNNTAVKNFLKLFAKYIMGEETLKDDILNGIKEILLIDGFKYKDPQIGKYYYIICNNKDLQLVNEDSKHINNFNSWYITNR